MSSQAVTSIGLKSLVLVARYVSLHFQTILAYPYDVPQTSNTRTQWESKRDVQDRQVYSPHGRHR